MEYHSELHGVCLNERFGTCTKVKNCAFSRHAHPMRVVIIEAPVTDSRRYAVGTHSGGGADAAIRAAGREHRAESWSATSRVGDELCTLPVFDERLEHRPYVGSTPSVASHFTSVLFQPNADRGSRRYSNQARATTQPTSRVYVRGACAMDRVHRGHGRTCE